MLAFDFKQSKQVSSASAPWDVHACTQGNQNKNFLNTYVQACFLNTTQPCNNETIIHRLTNYSSWWAFLNKSLQI